MTMYYSALRNNFYAQISVVDTKDYPNDLKIVPEDIYQELLLGMSEGKWVVPDENGMPMLQDPPPLPPPDPKLVGVEICGVMCSATKEDQSALLGVLAAYQLQGKNFKPTKFEFANGNILIITLDNIQEVIAKWTPFRQSFFAVT